MSQPLGMVFPGGRTSVRFPTARLTDDENQGDEMDGEQPTAEERLAALEQRTERLEQLIDRLLEDDGD